MAQNSNSNGKENKPNTPPENRPIPTDIGKARAGFPSGAPRIRVDDATRGTRPPETRAPETKK